MKEKIKKVFTRYPKLQQIFVDKKSQKVSIVRKKGYTVLTRKEFEGEMKTQNVASQQKQNNE